MGLDVYHYIVLSLFQQRLLTHAADRVWSNNQGLTPKSDLQLLPFCLIKVLDQYLLLSLIRRYAVFGLGRVLALGGALSVEGGLVESL